jgi:hypothetical protein
VVCVANKASVADVVSGEQMDDEARTVHTACEVRQANRGHVALPVGVDHAANPADEARPVVAVRSARRVAPARAVQPSLVHVVGQGGQASEVRVGCQVGEASPELGRVEGLGGGDLLDPRVSVVLGAGHGLAALGGWVRMGRVAGEGRAVWPAALVGAGQLVGQASVAYQA